MVLPWLSEPCRVRTYAVVPLLPDLGILEWVRETKPLKAVVQETAKAKDLNEVEAHKLRTEWPGSSVGWGQATRP